MKHTPSDQPSELFRTRNWLGQERIAFTYRRRRYSFRHLEDALHAQHRLRVGRRSYGGWMALVIVLIVLLSGARLLMHSPGLLLWAVDTTRSVVGPGPVAYVESQVFRLGTLVRETRVRMGDTAPRWSVEGALVPTGAPTERPMPTLPVVPAETSTPTLAPRPTDSSMPTQPPETRTVARGGNLRGAPLVDEANVLGWVMPGDQLEILERAPGEAQEWLKVRLVVPGSEQNERPIAPDSVGWISALLFEHVAPTPEPTRAATAAPTAPVLFAPTPIPPTPVAPPTAIPPTALPPTQEPSALPAEPIPASASGTWTLAPIPAVIGDGQVPNEGQWQLLPAAADGGDPVMAVTTFRPDVTRPDIQVAIAAIDMTRAQLHMVAGTNEPQSEVVTPTVALPREGRIPPGEYDRLLAAFNGGFKSLHGNDGMGVGEYTYRQPVKNRATIAAYADGSVRVGLWGREITPGSGIAAWRQNGHLLVEQGQVTPKALEGGLGWGASVEKQVETWRSGVGVSADGRTLLYAVGDALTSARLAEVLRAAGASNALQLDINNYWVRFVTFQRNDSGQIVSRPLISAMPQDRSKYLGVEDRDFMYLTRR